MDQTFLNFTVKCIVTEQQVVQKVVKCGAVGEFREDQIRFTSKGYSAFWVDS